MPLPEDVHAGLDRRLAPVDVARMVHAAWRPHAGPVRRALERDRYQGREVHGATGVDRTVLERLAGRTSRIGPPAAGGGGPRPTIPS